MALAPEQASEPSWPAGDNNALALAAPAPSSSSSSSSDGEGEASVADWMVQKLEDMGPEKASVKLRVYLGTLSRVLPETLRSRDLCDLSGLSREYVGTLVRDAWDRPVSVSGAGRPRAEEGNGQSVVDMMVVVREAHESGEVHFHVAVKLARSLRFLPAKAALRQRHRVASHWSCSHTQFWSAVRYCHIPSERKPEVDSQPYTWSADGSNMDLFALSQEPFTARMWKRRREDNEKAAAGVKKARSFTKLDLTATVLDQGLKSAAAILSYAQENGTAAMQKFVHQHQRRLKEFLEDAREWETARAVAAAERESDWELLCRTADGQCPHGASCPYEAAAAELFDRNKDVLSKVQLGFALREVIVKGPSKTTRTPLIVGPTNTGKTTLILPFDQLFGFKHVFHKPALHSKFALRNILKAKRFLLWDDFRPVEYARETVPTTTLLSLFTGLPFEVQVSQSFNDGNEDFEWRHGAVVTAKEDGLWTPAGSVSSEDVRHLQSRFEVFRCNAKVPKLRDTAGCACHMARWVRDAAAEHDASAVLQQAVLPLASGTTGVSGAYAVEGMFQLVEQTKLPPAAASALHQELLELGAVHVRELGLSDWTSLQAWASLKPLEQRRLLCWLGAAAPSGA